ncbi:MAG TPA: DUF3783 domain-containing protein [Firmicutes bacterium]|nr:DUF3783 domain-containing protein [Bacillota bacterium]
MKARIQKETVLLYHLSEDTVRGKKIRDGLREMGIGIIDLSEEQLGEKLGYCAGMHGFSPAAEPYTGEVFPEEVMIMKDLSQSRLGRMFQKLQADGVELPGLKAMVTQYNKDWPLYQLFAELSREHAAFVEQEAQRAQAKTSDETEH